MEIDLNDYIDALPILAVFGCFVDSLTLKNCKNAANKESNRIDVIYNELKKMNADIYKTDDGLIIKRSNLKSAILNSYKDHRVAMSLSIAALSIKNVSEIQDIDCIDKTFPFFKEKFLNLGADIL